MGELGVCVVLWGAALSVVALSPPAAGQLQGAPLLSGLPRRNYTLIATAGRLGPIASLKSDLT